MLESHPIDEQLLPESHRTVCWHIQVSGEMFAIHVG